KKELDTTGALSLTLASGVISLAPEDLLIEMIQSTDYCSMEDNGVTVAIDVRLDAALIEEGFVRELVSKLQTMRKEAGFNVEDHITVFAADNEKVMALLQKNSATIQHDVLADAIVCAGVDGYTKEWDINGETVLLGVKRV
ncbi:MAG: DUF5915 domain-containing protein, partial [Ruthenibacterium sp.]